MTPVRPAASSIPFPGRPWFGRPGDLVALERRLASGIVVLTGPPGVGKSRLAAEYARSWPGEVAWCDVAGMADPAEIAATVGARLSLDDEGHLAAALDARDGLLLVLDEADDGIAAVPDLVSAWRSPRARWSCVVTTRTRLPRWDHVAVEPLSADASFALFADRVRSHLGAEVPLEGGQTARLMAQVGGLPLAIELAAAGARLYPAGEWADRLLGHVDRRAERFSSVDAAIDASWTSLPGTHRSALAACGLFHGEFDARLFEAVTDAPLAVLEDLLDTSLIQARDVGRFFLLAPIRRFVLAQPEADGPARARYGPAVVEAASRAARAARRGAGWDPLDRLRADLEAVKAAGGAEAVVPLAELYDAHGPVADPTAGLTPPPALAATFATLRARACIRRRAFEAAAASLVAVEPRTDLDRMLLLTARVELGVQTNRVDDLATVREALAALVDPSDRRRAADEARLALADLDRLIGRADGGLPWLAAVDTSDDLVVAALATAQRGMIAARDDLGVGLAEEAFRRAIDLFRRVGIPRWEGTVRRWLGVAFSSYDRIPEARVELEQAAIISRAAGDTIGEGLAVARCVGVALIERRVDLAQVAVARLAEIAPPSSSVAALAIADDGWVELTRGRTEAAAAALRVGADRLDALGLHAAAASYRVFLAVALRADPVRAQSVLDSARGVPGVPGPLLALGAQLIDGGEVRHPAGFRRCFLARVLAAAAERTVEISVARDGTWMAVDGQRVPLDRKPVLRRLLAVLAERPGEALDRDALVGAVWPHDRSRAESVHGRLHVALSTLRKLGLGRALVTTRVHGDAAYMLDAGVAVADP